MRRRPNDTAEWKAVRPVVVAWVASDVMWALIFVRAVRKYRRKAAQ